MSTDRVYQEELDQDRGELTDKMIQRAADDIVYRLFDGQKVGNLTLSGFLVEQEDVAELAYRMVIPGVGLPDVRIELETRLRKYLEGTTILVDYASDLANEEE